MHILFMFGVDPSNGHAHCGVDGCGLPAKIGNKVNEPPYEAANGTSEEHTTPF
jgi:hypothetical protein